MDQTPKSVPAESDQTRNWSALEPCPPIEGIIETAIYALDLDAMEEFYTRVLNLKRIGKEPGRHLFFDAGPSNVLLIFNPATTIQGHHLPAHGATGPGHVAFGVTTDALPLWRERLIHLKIEIETEITWPRGGHSIYFRDPAGHSVELISPGVWGTRAGW